MINKKAFYLAFTSGLVLFSMHIDAQVPTTQISISDIRSANGKIVLNVFKDKQTYEAEKPFKKFEFDKKSLNNGKMGISCQLEPGIYGITLVDDENQNAKIDKNFIGIPKEGFGFSNFYMDKMKRPSFDDFKTEIKSDGAKLVIKVKYM